MSSGNYERLTYETEATWTGTRSGSIREVPHTGVQMARSAQYFESRIVRSDRETQDIVRGTFSAGGTIGGELLYRKPTSTTTNAYDDWFRYVLFSNADWTTPEADVTTADSTATSVTKTTSFGAGWVVGDVVRVTVGTNAPKYQVITAKGGSGGTSVLTLSPGGLATGTGNVTVEHGSYVKNRITAQSMVITRAFNDLPNTGSPDQATEYPGSYLNGMTLELSTGGPVRMGWSIVSYDEVDDVSIPSVSAGYAASSYRVFDSVSSVKAFAEGSPLATFTATQLSLELTNNINPRTEIAVEGASSMRIGSLGVSGSFTRYFADNAQLAAFKANTETAIFVALQDSLGNGLVFWAPSVVIQGASRTGGGKDTDIEVQANWRAKKSATYGETFRITRFDA